MTDECDTLNDDDQRTVSRSPFVFSASQDSHNSMKHVINFGK